jgi:hypothetical protein
VVALACQLPAATGVPLGRRAGPELAAELAARGLAGPMSASSVLRILAGHPVRPWQYQSGVYPRDPDSGARAKVIVDLYQGCYQGEPLGPGDRILSFDAKPQINARSRLHPALPAAPGRPVRYEHEYKARAPSRCWPGWTCTPGGVRLHPAHHRDQAVHGPRRAGHGLPAVQERVPGLRHRGQRLGPPRPGRHHPAGQSAPQGDHDPHPAARLVAEPEIFFSVIQKKAVTPNDFGSLEQLSATLLGFIARYNQTARPFSWKFTASDLHDLMDRISRREQQDDPQDKLLLQAA